MKNADLIQHRGRFAVPGRIVEHDFDGAQKIFKDMIVTRCEFMHGSQMFEYEACGPMFSKVEDYQRTPVYDVITRRDGSITFDLAKVQY